MTTDTSSVIVRGACPHDCLVDVKLHNSAGMDALPAATEAAHP